MLVLERGLVLVWVLEQVLEVLVRGEERQGRALEREQVLEQELGPAEERQGRALEREEVLERELGPAEEGRGQGEQARVPEPEEVQMRGPGEERREQGEQVRVLKLEEVQARFETEWPS